MATNDLLFDLNQKQVDRINDHLHKLSEASLEQRDVGVTKKNRNWKFEQLIASTEYDKADFSGVTLMLPTILSVFAVILAGAALGNTAIPVGGLIFVSVLLLIIVFAVAHWYYGKVASKRVAIAICEYRRP